jgi:NADH dehydrogenase
MLAEVVAGDVGILDTVSPLRQLLAHTDLFVREIEGVDLERRVVTLGAGSRRRRTSSSSTTWCSRSGTSPTSAGIPGLPEHALPFKTLADAVRIRNHVINVLEQSSVVRDAEVRRTMLTFVVAGGGFSGTEVAAALNDFVREAVAHYRSIPPEDVRIVLVHSGTSVLERELTPQAREIRDRTLAEQGIELLLGERLVAASPRSAVLSDGTRIATRTLISTVPSSPNPVVEQLGLPTDRGRLECDATTGGRRPRRRMGGRGLRADPDARRRAEPADRAARDPPGEGARANIVATRKRGAPRRSFAFTGLGKLGALGHHRAVAELPGGITVQGLPAWLMWRGIYWSKLPGAARKTRVAVSWLSDLVLPPHPVQLNLGGGRGATQAHYEPGETVFEEGDTGDSLFMILSGQVEVLKRFGGEHAGGQDARAGRVLRRDGAARAPPAQRRHASAERARPARAARVGLLGARREPHRVRGEFEEIARGCRGLASESLRRDASRSPAIEDYSKAIFALESRSDEPVSTNALAERLGITPGSVSAMLKKLDELGLITHVPYRGVRLTADGRRVALEVIRHHRLLESFLADALGMPWDRVHAEAEVLEHVLSEELEELIAAKLGHPTVDPTATRSRAPTWS